MTIGKFWYSIWVLTEDSETLYCNIQLDCLNYVSYVVYQKVCDDDICIFYFLLYNAKFKDSVVSDRIKSCPSYLFGINKSRI